MLMVRSRMLETYFKNSEQWVKLFKYAAIWTLCLGINVSIILNSEKLANPVQFTCSGEVFFTGSQVLLRFAEGAAAP